MPNATQGDDKWIIMFKCHSKDVKSQRLSKGCHISIQIGNKIQKPNLIESLSRAPYWIQLDPTGFKRIQLDSTGLNRIQPGSNRIQPDQPDPESGGLRCGFMMLLKIGDRRNPQPEPPTVIKHICSKWGMAVWVQEIVQYDIHKNSTTLVPTKK